jgi:hypothetical protein
MHQSDHLHITPKHKKWILHRIHLTKISSLILFGEPINNSTEHIHQSTNINSPPIYIYLYVNMKVVFNCLLVVGMALVYPRIALCGWINLHLGLDPVLSPPVLADLHRYFV